MIAEANWEGKCVAELKAVEAEKVWSCLEDFCDIQKWLPHIETCHQLEGNPGQPYLMRNQPLDGLKRSY